MKNNKKFRTSLILISLSFGLAAFGFIFTNTQEIDKSTYKDIYSLVNTNKSCQILKDTTCNALRDEKISLFELYGINKAKDQC